MIDVCAFEHRILMIDLFNLHCCGGLVAKLEATILFVNNFFFTECCSYIHIKVFCLVNLGSVCALFFWAEKNAENRTLLVEEKNEDFPCCNLESSQTK